MPFKVQRVPLGLPSFLRIFGGEGPRTMADEAVYTVDATPYYAATTLSSVTSTPGNGALANLFAFVTFGQAVRLREVGARLVIGVAGGANVNVTWGIVLPTAGVPEHAYGQHSFPAVIATEQLVVGTMVDIVVPGGTQLWTRASGAPGGADHALQARGIFDQLI